MSETASLLTEDHVRYLAARTAQEDGFLRALKGNMNRVLLVHWNAAGAAKRRLQLEATGYQVIYEPKLGPEFLRELKADPPVAVLVDLTRLPSHGRDVAMAIRHAV